MKINTFSLRSHRNWIIQAILKESSKYSDAKFKYYEIPELKRHSLNPFALRNRFLRSEADIYLYGNHKTLFLDAEHNRLPAGRIHVFYTQIQDKDELANKFNHSILNSVDRIIVQNLNLYKALVKAGINQPEIRINPGAVDRNIFHPSPSIPRENFVLVSGDFKARKRPELIAKVILSMPKIEFLIHGKNTSTIINEFAEFPRNITVKEFDFSAQADLMRNARLFLNLSSVEGGPYSVLESLASGTPCVVTNVGICGELINKDNGFLLGQNPSLEEVINGIKSAWELKEKCFNKDLLGGRFTWKQLCDDFYVLN